MNKQIVNIILFSIVVALLVGNLIENNRREQTKEPEPVGLTVEPPGCLLNSDVLISVIEEEYSFCVTEEGGLYLNPDPWVKAGEEAAEILGYNPYLEKVRE